MSPSERAADLIAKFSPHVEIHKWDGKNESHKDEYHYSPIKSVANAKACAIICCDEIIDVLDKKFTGSGDIYFYQSVKTEIQKL